ncbi:MAG: hypothetical protein ACT4O9_01365 [Blastocatellia bacterium]
MRTTITLDKDVELAVKEEMKTGDGKTFKEAVNELIRLGRYFKQERATKQRKPFKVKAKNLGLYEHLNYDKTSELLGMLDDEEFIRKTRKAE